MGDLYRTDLALWAAQQADALRSAARERHNLPVDWENVAEEIESLGASERRALASHVRTVVEHLMCKNRYSTCRTVSDDGVPTASLSVPRPDALPSSPAPSAPRYAAAGLDGSARPRDPHWCRRRSSVRVARGPGWNLVRHCPTNPIPTRPCESICSSPPGLDQAGASTDWPCRTSLMA